MWVGLWSYLVTITQKVVSWAGFRYDMDRNLELRRKMMMLVTICSLTPQIKTNVLKAGIQSIFVATTNNQERLGFCTFLSVVFRTCLSVRKRNLRKEDRCPQWGTPLDVRAMTLRILRFPREGLLEREENTALRPCVLITLWTYSTPKMLMMGVQKT